MTKTEGNAYGYVEQYPDPTAREAIDHLQGRKRKKKSCVFHQVGRSFRWRCSVCGMEFWLADGPVKAGMKKCPNCEKRIMAEERNII